MRSFQSKYALAQRFPAKYFFLSKKKKKEKKKRSRARRFYLETIFKSHRLSRKDGMIPREQIS